MSNYNVRADYREGDCRDNTSFDSDGNGSIWSEAEQKVKETRPNATLQSITIENKDKK